MRHWQPSTWPGQPRPACGWAGFSALAPAPGLQSGCPRPPALGAPPQSRTAAQTLCCERRAWRRRKHCCGWALAWPPAAPSRRLVRQTSGPCCPQRWAGVGLLGLTVLCLLAVGNHPTQPSWPDALPPRSWKGSICIGGVRLGLVTLSCCLQALDYAELLLEPTLRPVRLHCLEPTPALQVGGTETAGHARMRMGGVGWAGAVPKWLSLHPQACWGYVSAALASQLKYLVFLPLCSALPWAWRSALPRRCWCWRRWPAQPFSRATAVPGWRASLRLLTLTCWAGGQASLARLFACVVAARMEIAWSCRHALAYACATMRVAATIELPGIATHRTHSRLLSAVCYDTCFTLAPSIGREEEDDADADDDDLIFVPDEEATSAWLALALPRLHACRSGRMHPGCRLQRAGLAPPHNAFCCPAPLAPNARLLHASACGA